jgi:hypothetical protein
MGTHALSHHSAEATATGCVTDIQLKIELARPTRSWKVEHVRCTDRSATAEEPVGCSLICSVSQQRPAGSIYLRAVPGTGVPRPLGIETTRMLYCILLKFLKESK